MKGLILMVLGLIVFGFGEDKIAMLGAIFIAIGMLFYALDNK